MFDEFYEDNLLVGKYTVFGNFSGRNTFSKIVALIVLQNQIKLEVDKGFNQTLSKYELCF